MAVEAWSSWCVFFHHEPSLLLACLLICLLVLEVEFRPLLGVPEKELYVQVEEAGQDLEVDCFRSDLGCDFRWPLTILAAEQSLKLLRNGTGNYTGEV